MSEVLEFNLALGDPEAYLETARRRVANIEAELRESKEKGNDLQSEEISKRLADSTKELRELIAKISEKK